MKEKIKMNFMSDLLSKIDLYEKLLIFVSATTLSYFGLNIDVKDSVKTGIIATLASAVGMLLAQNIMGMNNRATDYESNLVYDQNEKNLRAIDGEY